MQYPIGPNETLKAGDLIDTDRGRGVVIDPEPDAYGMIAVRLTALTDKDVVAQLNAMTRDATRSHIAADDLLCEFLRLEGYEHVADAFEQARTRLGFWYE